MITVSVLILILFAIIITLATFAAYPGLVILDVIVLILIIRKAKKKKEENK